MNKKGQDSGFKTIFYSSLVLVGIIIGFVVVILFSPCFNCPEEPTETSDWEFSCEAVPYGQEPKPCTWKNRVTGEIRKDETEWKPQWVCDEYTFYTTLECYGVCANYYDNSSECEHVECEETENKECIRKHKEWRLIE